MSVTIHILRLHFHFDFFFSTIPRMRYKTYHQVGSWKHYDIRLWKFAFTFKIQPKSRG